jgi:signal transduction histidine kinase
METQIGERLSVKGDPDLLFQAVANLLDNAVKHGPQNGSILLSAGRRADYVKISISDSGPGIPQNERERVFDRFYRVPGSEPAPGVGLGLSLVRSVAELHGGAVRFGEPAVGSVAILTLPAG